MEDGLGPIFVSSIHSGPNPSPGLGIARSLRDYHDSVTIVGVDYSNESSGIHHDVFDRIKLFEPWNDVSLPAQVRDIDDLLIAEDGFWIPGNDLEIATFAEEIPNQERILSPGINAYSNTRKPEIPAVENLPFEVPPSINAFSNPLAVADFCRQHGWKVWIKGPDYQAKRVEGWTDLLETRTKFLDRWNTSDITLQANINGLHKSIVFAGFNGELLGAVQMEKNVQTDEGKTWTGTLKPLSDNLQTDLENVLKTLNWTGGGELEYIEPEIGDRYLIDWNIRFPAWIHGTTVNGINLPGRLYAAANGADEGANHSTFTNKNELSFTRTLQEIPVNPSYPPPDPEPETIKNNGGLKHPSAIPELAQELRAPAKLDESPTAAPPQLAEAVDSVSRESVDTPATVFLENVLSSRLDSAESLLRKREEGRTTMELAYSIKTNPAKEILQAVNDRGFGVEAISEEEIRWALQNGFSTEEIVVNGPIGTEAVIDQNWEHNFRAIFADSIPAFERLAENKSEGAQLIGIRINPPDLDSRFGVDVDTKDQFDALCETLAAAGNRNIGIQFHVRSSEIGLEEWYGVVQAIINSAKEIEGTIPGQITTLDIGGGWSPHTFDQDLPSRLPELRSWAENTFADLQTLILEPGKAIARPTNCLVTKVIERRKFSRGDEIVVDGSIAELPLVNDQPVPILIQTNREWRQLEPGSDRILGRLCMESDILGDYLSIPSSVGRGDIVIFGESGGYNQSMSYRFGKGAE